MDFVPYSSHKLEQGEVFLVAWGFFFVVSLTFFVCAWLVYLFVVGGFLFLFFSKAVKLMQQE